MPIRRPASLLLASVLAAGSLLLATTATAAEEVNVYSYRQPFLIKPIFSRFTDETGIVVNTVYANKGLVERLQQEGRNSPADLFITPDIGPLQAALDAGVTAPLTNTVLEAQIPAEYRDPDGHWFGVTTRARIIVTSKDRVTKGEISSYEDLADPAFEGRICTRSGKHNYMVALIASMIAHHGLDDTREWLSGVKNNLARKPQGNDRAQVKAIAEGQCDIAIINTYYMGNMMNDEEQAAWADSVDIVFPNQADRGTHMNISGVSLTQAAPNRDNAIRLMEYMAGDEAQRLYAEQNFEYPIRSDVPRSALVDSWGSFKADTLPLAEIAANRSAATRLVDEVGYDN